MSLEVEKWAMKRFKEHSLETLTYVESNSTLFFFFAQFE